MRIKKVEIIGFKSFCDRAVIHLESSITAVVGPNGCGKSNIVDAIRWCMGEQSAKHLRGKAMEDVIFAGSESRGPAAMAEVSLTFDDVGFSEEQLKRAREEDDTDELGAAESDVDEGAEPSDFTAADGDPEAAAGPAEPAERDAVGEAGLLGEWSPLDNPGVDFAKFTEVTITRRLYRDGSSHYLINKTPCRLRDVTDFFLGTGVGTKAYSIIEQGRIGQIVSSRPQDRRAIIEEAAGITKFKTRKKAAEKKLEQTKQNLLRVSDITSELDKRMGLLRRQAQKAERFRNYKSEMRELELCKAAHRCLELIAEQSTVQQRLGDVARELAEARQALASGDEAIIALREQLALREQDLALASEQVVAVDAAISLAKSQREFAERDLQQWAQLLEQTRIERAALGEGQAAAEADAAQMGAGASAAAEAVDRLTEGLLAAEDEIAGLRLELEAKRRAVADVRAALSELRQELRGLETSRDLQAARVRELNAREEALVQQLEQTSALVRAASGELAEQEQRLAALQQTRLDLGNQEAQFAARCAELAERVLHLETETETLRTETHRRRSRLQSLIEIQERLEGYTGGTRAVVSALKDDARIRGLLADRISAPQRLEAAVEAVLGHHLEGVVVADLASGLSAVEYLKREGAGRASFVPVAGGGQPGGAPIFEDRTAEMAALRQVGSDGVVGPLQEMLAFGPEVASIGQRLVAPYVVVDSVPRAVALREAGMERPMVTLEGDILDQAGVLHGGSKSDASGSLLAQRREIRELTELVEDLERTLADRTMALVATKSEHKQVERALEALRSQEHAEALALLSVQKDVARTRQELETQRQRQQQLALELEQTRELGRELLGKRDVENARIDAIAHLLAASTDDEMHLAASVVTRQEEVDARVQVLADVRVQLAEQREKLTALRDSSVRLQRQLSEMAERERVLAEQCARAEQQREVRGEELADAEQRLERLAAEQQVALAALQQAKTLVEEQAQLVHTEDARLRGDRQRADTLAAEHGQLELRRASLGMNQQVLHDAMFDRYQVEIEKELFDYHLRPRITPEQEQRVGELRELLDRMGTDINLTAIDEYNEVAQRFEFLSSQKSDLEMAVSQLERAIDKMNKTSRKLFRETYAAVNATFREVFPRLFRGGQASLSLTGGDDVDMLEAGVEIMAQPPGKKNATVDQLSGGEKALTAVALVFSIFLIKPSPFCILDEVDAPLDEANVDRYNEIVREMTNRSQFIIITHNKRTMESADNLYGVTMQEAGVSKLVSVNLSRVGQQRASA